jgi:hypothetical protein
MVTRSVLNILPIYVEDLVSWLQLVHARSTFSHKPAIQYNYITHTTLYNCGKWMIKIKSDSVVKQVKLSL